MRSGSATQIKHRRPEIDDPRQNQKRLEMDAEIQHPIERQFCFTIVTNRGASRVSTNSEKTDVA
jgi:hypothetical protein